MSIILTHVSMILTHENVSQCWNFQAGDCDRYWFNHEVKEKNSFEFKCSYCDKTFLNKSEYFKHKNLQHKENVSSCKGYADGSCWNGDVKRFREN